MSKLREAREKKGLTVAELAVKSKVSFGAISKYESGERADPRTSCALKIARALKTTVEKLWG